MEELTLQTLQKLITGIESGGQFILDQAPDVIQQMIAYELLWSYIIAGSLLLISIVSLIIHFITEDIDYSMISGIIFFCLTPALYVPIKTITKIKVAPKVFILDKINDQIRRLK